MARIPGVGLAKGLSITLRHMLRKSVTQQYPEVRPALPPRSRGVIALVEENCTSCMLCARECPDWCIYIDSHKETIPAPEGGRARQRNVLDRFAIDFSLCMYCGICIEVCPFDALFWSPEFEYAEGDIRNLLHEKDKLAAWTQTVPPPPAHDPGAEPPKELTAAPRRPARTAAAADRPPRTPAADRPTRPSSSDDSARTPTEGQATDPPRADTARPGVPAPDTEATDVSPAGRSRTPDEPATPQTRSDEPSAPSGRPRRSMANVRGIRPPGALPTPPKGDAPTTPAEEATRPSAQTGEDESRPQTGENTSSSQTQATPEPPPEGPSEAEPPTESQAETEPSSTGRPPPEKLSTASGEAQPSPDPEEQTSAASPRRRKMADPRSIRPPGGLGPGETRESEEES
ncbi:4Fe-4S binding protein [Nonomuraea fuscirosea]|uniref:NuoI/complex I 23 kDa subunit family protein n=1 Tax=Nonomuraea fuscirosea TaxID=1291556 RepID=UPI002DD9BF4E|nr:4Fe-4S binding protein [Nonomuraea fuscirosea]WSA51077.1 4Fe-4S binding protein [Nonomuraea fuscirosea]